MAFTTRDGETRSSLAEINMVPFIDVVLVLLIIFMITAPVLESNLPVTVPPSEAGQTAEKRGVTITIDREERVFVDDEPVSMDSLQARLENSAAVSAGNVYVRSDETVPFATVAAVLDRVALAGIRDVNFVTTPLDDTP